MIIDRLDEDAVHAGVCPGLTALGLTISPAVLARADEIIQ